MFGGVRRQVESLAAQAEYQRFQLEATYLTLTSNVVVAAVQEASLRGQIAATRDIIRLETEQLDMVQQPVRSSAARRDRRADAAGDADRDAGHAAAAAEAAGADARPAHRAARPASRARSRRSASTSPACSCRPNCR